MMRVHLSWETGKYLKGLGLFKSGSQGILLGHKQGHDCYIEQVFPYDEVLSLTDKAFAQIDQHFDDRVIGFYVFSSDEKITRKILAPFSVGKIVLKLCVDENKGLLLDPFFIDYDGKFYLKPIKAHQMGKD